MVDQGTRLTRLLRALEQAGKSVKLEIVQSQSRIFDLRTQRGDIETVMARQADFTDLMMTGVVSRLARIAAQISLEERLCTNLRQKATQYAIKCKLVEKRLAAAVVQQNQMMARRELDELACRAREARLPQVT